MFPDARRNRSPQMYRLPKKFLNGSAAEMLFWHAIYYLFATKGRKDPEGTGQLITSRAELVELTGLSERQINEERNTIFQQIPPQYNLQEDESPETHSYLFLLRSFDAVLQKHVIEMPVVYIQRGWLKFIYTEGRKSGHGRLPIVILNRFLALKPGQRSFTIKALCPLCRRPDRKSNPTPANVRNALYFLQRLGLVQWHADSETWQLVEDRLCMEATPPAEVSAVQQARLRHPQRAALALELAGLGNFSLEQHFEEIFRDLNYIHLEHDLERLKEKVVKCRRKEPSANRWQDCWNAFCHERRRNRFYSEKVKVSFRRSAKHVVELSLPGAAHCVSLRYAKLTLWIDDPDYHLVELSNIQFTIQQDNHVLWATQLTHEDGTKHKDLTAQIRSLPAYTYSVQIEAPQTIPRASISMQLEAECYHSL